MNDVTMMIYDVPNSCPDLSDLNEIWSWTKFESNKMILSSLTMESMFNTVLIDEKFMKGYNTNQFKVISKKKCLLPLPCFLL